MRAFVASVVLDYKISHDIPAERDSSPRLLTRSSLYRCSRESHVNMHTMRESVLAAPEEMGPFIRLDATQDGLRQGAHPHSFSLSLLQYILILSLFLSLSLLFFLLFSFLFLSFSFDILLLKKNRCSFSLNYRSTIEWEMIFVTGFIDQYDELAIRKK